MKHNMVSKMEKICSIKKQILRLWKNPSLLKKISSLLKKVFAIKKPVILKISLLLTSDFERLNVVSWSVTWKNLRYWKTNSSLSKNFWYWRKSLLYCQYCNMKNYGVSKNKLVAIKKILQYFNKKLCVIGKKTLFYWIKKLLLLASQYYNPQSKIIKKYCIYGLSK